MTFLDDYVHPSKGWLGKASVSILFGLGFWGGYSLMDRASVLVETESLEGGNLKALEGFLEDYNSLSESNGIKKDNSKLDISEILDSWKELPTDDRYDTLRFMLEDGSKDSFYNLRDITEENSGRFGLFLLGRG